MIDTGNKDQKLNQCMKDFVSVYMHTAQLLYDMMPLAACLGDDPYLSQFKAGEQLLLNYKMLTEKTHIDLIKRANIQRINKHLPYTTNHTEVHLRRVKANEFKLKNRYETADERCTIFSQFMKAYRNPERWKKRDNRPFSVELINENSADAGGPMRDTISNLCTEIMSDVLPLLIPTGNNLAQVEPSMDCY